MNLVQNGNRIKINNTGQQVTRVLQKWGKSAKFEHCTSNEL